MQYHSAGPLTECCTPRQNWNHSSGNAMDSLNSGTLLVNYDSSYPIWHYSSMPLFKTGDWNLSIAVLTPNLNSKWKQCSGNQKKKNWLIGRVHNCKHIYFLVCNQADFHINFCFCEPYFCSSNLIKMESYLFLNLVIYSHKENGSTHKELALEYVLWKT